MTNYEIDTQTFDARVDLYEKIKRELSSGSHGLSIWTVEGWKTYAVIDDGQDRWIAESGDLDAALEHIFALVLRGSITSNDCWYTELCGYCSHIVSRLGSGSLEDIEALGEDSATTLKLCEEWGYPPEDIPDQLDGERFAVLDEETGEATGHLIQFGERWLYWDDTDGFRLISDEDKQRLTVEEISDEEE